MSELPPQWLKDWMTVAGPLVTGVGLGFTVWGIHVATWRGRNELTSNLLFNWAKDIEWAPNRAIQIARRLASDERNTLASINAGKSTCIKTDYYEGILVILRGNFEKEAFPKETNGDTFLISEEHSLFIRFLWNKWLNRLEGSLVPWQLKAGNRKALEENFGPVARVNENIIKLLAKEEELPITYSFLRRIR